MSKAYIEFPGGVSPDIGQRWAQILRQQYPERNAAKNIARDFGCETRTATAWLGGNPPQTHMLARAAQVLGPAAIAAVLFPETHFYCTAELNEAIEDLETRIDRLKTKLRGISARHP